jgi:hypothetical protein
LRKGHLNTNHGHNGDRPWIRATYNNVTTFMVRLIANLTRSMERFVVSFHEFGWCSLRNSMHSETQGLDQVEGRDTKPFDVLFISILFTGCRLPSINSPYLILQNTQIVIWQITMWLLQSSSLKLPQLQGYPRAGACTLFAPFHPS